MDNLLDIYTRLKLHYGYTIKITYFTNDNHSHTKEAILLDVYDFSSIYIETDKELLSIPFISSHTIIKSIYLLNNNIPIYFNSYIEQVENPFLNYEVLKEKIFNSNTINKDIIEKRKEIINKYLAKYTTVQYKDLFFSKHQQQEFEIFFNMLIDELTKYAIKNGYDSTLKKISAGTTSIIYELGDKIIKIGKPRRSNSIPYCEYILQPIINKVFEFDNYPIHIEVTQKAFTMNNQDELGTNIKLFNQIVSNLQEKLYNIGLQAYDLHPANVGILLQDNKIHFDDIDFETSPEDTTSIKNNNNQQILKKGNYVIIDLDLLEIENEEKYQKYLESISKSKTKKLSKKREIK